MQRGNKAVNIILIIAVVIGGFYAYSYYRVDLDRNMLNGRMREELTGRRVRIELTDAQLKQEIINMSHRYKTINIEEKDISITDSTQSGMKTITVKWQYTYDLPLLNKTRELVVERDVQRR